MKFREIKSLNQLIIKRGISIFIRKGDEVQPFISINNKKSFPTEGFFILGYKLNM
jgi:hypothetical protein